MIPEDKLLFACARQNFQETQQQVVLDLYHRKEIDWEIVYSTAELHHVAPLVYFNLQQCIPLNLKIPQAIVDKFKRELHRNIIVKEKTVERITEALSFFNQKSISVMMAKGAALDVLVYDQPWYTVIRDVDLIIKPTQAEISDDQQAEFMYFFHRSGIEYDYFAHHDIVMNGVLPVDFRRIWGDATKIDYEGQSVWVMSPEDMLLSICVNSCRKRFFRLKSLVDIAAVIDKCSDLDWTELTRRARLYDCQNIVYAALLTTKITVDCEVPDAVFSNLKVNPIRAAIIRYLIHYLSQKMSLLSIYPFSGRTLFGREVNISLILPYATYRWYQVGRKTKEIFRAWRQPVDKYEK